MRPRFGVSALNADREECWVLEREAPEHQRGIGQVGAWIVRHGQRFETFLEQLECPGPERPQEPFLRPEEAVDGARRRTGVACELAQRESADAALLDRPLGRLE